MAFDEQLITYLYATRPKTSSEAQRKFVQINLYSEGYRKM